MGEAMGSAAEDARLGGLLAGPLSKGESAAELDGLVRAMDAHAVAARAHRPFLDIVGTGRGAGQDADGTPRHAPGHGDHIARYPGGKPGAPRSRTSRTSTPTISAARRRSA